MSSVVISGDTSGTVTVAAPAVAGSNTLTLQAATATNAINTLATAVASTSGTSIDFTNLPSWVKRITVMYSGVSTNSTSNYLIQLGTGSTTFTTSGYVSSCRSATSTAGFLVIDAPTAASLISGAVTLTNLGSNTWVSSGVLQISGSSAYQSAGVIALGAALTAVRITSVTPDTFDAGTVNILYEG